MTHHTAGSVCIGTLQPASLASSKHASNPASCTTACSESDYKPSANYSHQTSHTTQVTPLPLPHANAHSQQCCTNQTTNCCCCCSCMHAQMIMSMGFSTNCLKALSHSAPTAPSTTRWSQLSVTFITRTSSKPRCVATTWDKKTAPQQQQHAHVRDGRAANQPAGLQRGAAVCAHV